MPEDREIAEALVKCQQDLDQAWEVLRDLVAGMTHDQVLHLWRLGRRTTPPTFLSQDEWILLGAALQIAIKQIAVNTARRQMEEQG